MFFGCLSLVEAGQGAVMALVEPPSLLDRQVRLVDPCQDFGQRGLGAGQKRGVSHVEGVAGVSQGLATSLGLLHPGLAQVRVVPDKT